jgi:ATP sulfurylase
MTTGRSFHPAWPLLIATTGLGGVIIAAVKLIWPIVFPVIIRYPWPTNAANARQQRRDQRTVVAFCGSFNPPHNGHLAMMIYLAERYDGGCRLLLLLFYFIT